MKQIESVFLIDDDKVFNMIHTKIIKHTVSVKLIDAFEYAGDAINTLKELALFNPEGIPDMILLDINMPEMDGWAFLEEFEKLPPVDTLQKCRIFLLTSSIDPSDIEKSKTYSIVSDFISKPLTPDKIHLLFGQAQR